MLHTELSSIPEAPHSGGGGVIYTKMSINTSATLEIT